MKPQVFAALVKAQEKIEFDVLIQRAAQYARGGDRLHNFYKGAKLDDTTPEKACTSLVRKQIVALYDAIDDLEKGRIELHDMVLIGELITDIRNYMMLLLGIVVEHNAQVETVTVGTEEFFVTDHERAELISEVSCTSHIGIIELLKHSSKKLKG